MFPCKTVWSLHRLFVFYAAVFVVTLPLCVFVAMMPLTRQFFTSNSIGFGRYTAVFDCYTLVLVATPPLLSLRCVFVITLPFSGRYTAVLVVTLPFLSSHCPFLVVTLPFRSLHCCFFTFSLPFWSLPWRCCFQAAVFDYTLLFFVFMLLLNSLHYRVVCYIAFIFAMLTFCFYSGFWSLRCRFWLLDCHFGR